MNAVVLSPNDFDRFITEMKQHLSREVKEIKAAVVEKPLCVKEACEYLGIHENTLWKRIRSGKIPANLVHRVDGTIYFFQSELHNFIKKS